MRLGGGIDDRGHVLVSAGRLLGDAAQRWTADEDATRRKLVDHPASLPVPRRLGAAHAAAGAVTRGSERRLAAALTCSGKDVRRRPHAAADQHRLAGFGERARQFRVTGTECARRALAMNEESPPAAVDDMVLDLARVVRNIVEQGKDRIRQYRPDDAACQMS